MWTPILEFAVVEMGLRPLIMPNGAGGIGIRGGGEGHLGQAMGEMEGREGVEG